MQTTPMPLCSCDHGASPDIVDCSLSTAYRLVKFGTTLFPRESLFDRPAMRSTARQKTTLVTFPTSNPSNRRSCPIAANRPRAPTRTVLPTRPSAHAETPLGRASKRSSTRARLTCTGRAGRGPDGSSGGAGREPGHATSGPAKPRRRRTSRLRSPARHL